MAAEPRVATTVMASSICSKYHNAYSFASAHDVNLSATCRRRAAWAACFAIGPDIAPREMSDMSVARKCATTAATRTPAETERMASSTSGMVCGGRAACAPVRDPRLPARTVCTAAVAARRRMPTAV